MQTICIILNSHADIYDCPFLQSHVKDFHGEIIFQLNIFCIKAIGWIIMYMHAFIYQKSIEKKYFFSSSEL